MNKDKRPKTIIFLFKLSVYLIYSKSHAKITNADASTSSHPYQQHLLAEHNFNIMQDRTEEWKVPEVQLVKMQVSYRIFRQFLVVQHNETNAIYAIPIQF